MRAVGGRVLPDEWLLGKRHTEIHAAISLTKSSSVRADAIRGFDQRFIALGHAEPHDAHAGGRLTIERREGDYGDAGLVDQPLGEFHVVAASERPASRE